MGKWLVVGLIVLVIALSGCTEQQPSPNPEAQRDPTGYFCRITEMEIPAKDGKYVITVKLGESAETYTLEVKNNEPVNKERVGMFDLLFHRNNQKGKMAAYCPKAREGTTVEYVGQEQIGNSISDCFTGTSPQTTEGGQTLGPYKFKACYDHKDKYETYASVKIGNGPPIIQTIEYET